MQSYPRSRRMLFQIFSCAAERTPNFIWCTVQVLAALKLAIDRGWLWLDRSGTYVKFTQAGAELFA
jgi:hypothetical protein